MIKSTLFVHIETCPFILSALRFITKCNDIRYLAVIFLLMLVREKQRVARNCHPETSET
jgi:hypothetical protein